MSEKKVLLIEPYFGGSHKQFLEGLMKYVEVNYILIHLPARKWKMRMQLSAPWFVQKIKEMAVEERQFDIVLMSTFIDVAVFRALVNQVEGWNPDTRFYTYFHENQFGYPTVLSKTTSHQFTSINFTTALASDKLAFNSSFNREVFLSQSHRYLSKAVDIELLNELDHIAKKSCVLYPGIDYQTLDSMESSRQKEEVPLIIWNHRWEYDKNPQEFFQTLYRLADEGIPFRLAVMGQSFRRQPDIFAEAKKRLEHVIDYYGYVVDKVKYYEILKQGRFIVSTALHEFFGISILEGVRAGCYPLVPDRLSYPELFEKRFRYDNDEGALFKVLKAHLIARSTLDMEEAVMLTERYSWQVLAHNYYQWFKKE